MLGWQIMRANYGGLGSGTGQKSARYPLEYVAAKETRRLNCLYEVLGLAWHRNEPAWPARFQVWGTGTTLSIQQ